MFATCSNDGSIAVCRMGSDTALKTWPGVPQTEVGWPTPTAGPGLAGARVQAVGVSAVNPVALQARPLALLMPSQTLLCKHPLLLLLLPSLCPCCTGCRACR